MDHDFVKEQLTKLGYTNLTDDLIDEFLEKLQEEDDLPIIPTIPKRFTSNKFQSENITQKRSSTQTRIQSTTIEESSITNNSEQTKQNRKSKFKKHQTSGSSRKKGSKDKEISEWSQKLKSIKSKGEILDNHIQKYKSTMISPPDEIVDVPIYFGPGADNKRDPYPYVIKKKSGGFIRPPPIRGTRKHIDANGHKLTYEERFPYYIPVTERRRNKLRWEIHQKLVYSDPKYH